MISDFVSKIGGSSIGAAAVKAIVLSGTISLFSKFFGLLKEIIIANYFGVSSQLDIYILMVLSLLFFVNPVAGAMGTLLTQKYLEIKIVSEGVVASIYKKSIFFCSLLIFICIILLTFILLTPIFNQILPNQFLSILNMDLFVLAPIAIFSVVSIINGAVLTAEKQFKLFSFIPITVPISISFCIIIDVADSLFYSLILGTVLGYLLEMLIGTMLLRNLWIKKCSTIQSAGNDRFREMRSGFLSLFLSGLIMGGCIVVDQFMASIVGDGSVSIINFASRLPYGLLSVFGIIWVVLYPFFQSWLQKEKSTN